MNELDDESLIITSFFDFASKFKNIVHYNGNGFDIPYIEAKCKLYNIPYSFNIFESYDLYKVISPFKIIFKTENIKQKTMEKFLGINRNDTFSGGELINLFEEYMRNHNTDLRENILLHNFDDIKGLLFLCDLFNYSSIFNGNFTVDSVKYNIDDNGNYNYATINCKTTFYIKERVSNGHGPFYFTMYNNTLIVKVDIYTAGLKYFYPNYKDYYYLPNEDCSIHKSVAFYVDKEFRTKAKAANCYSKKTGRFLPQITETIKPYFKINYEDSMTYFELTDEILNLKYDLKEYVLEILNYLKK